MLEVVSPATAANASSRPMSVLIVDDQQFARTIIRHVIEGVFRRLNVIDFENPAEALRWSESNGIDLLLLDYRMPGMNGLEFAREFRRNKLQRDVPIVLISVVDDEPVRQAALNAGILDFLVKPVRPGELRSRCKHLLSLRLREELAVRRARTLQEQVEHGLRKIGDREREIVLRLTRATEFRDAEVGLHLSRVSGYAGLVARQLGMPEEQAIGIELAARLHDIGKMGIPDSIVQMSDSLPECNLAQMRRHTTIGYEILRDSDSRVVQLGSTVALCHHERWDGGGYPHGLAGDDIPHAARIVGVADAFDELSSKSFRTGTWSHDQVVEYMVQNRGVQFDSTCVDALLDDRNLLLRVGS
jgi:two-component system, response regulator RpfG